MIWGDKTVPRNHVPCKCWSTDPLHTLQSLRSGSQNTNLVSNGFMRAQIIELHCLRTLTKELWSYFSKKNRLFIIPSHCYCYPPDNHTTDNPTAYCVFINHTFRWDKIKAVQVSYFIPSLCLWLMISLLAFASQLLSKAMFIWLVFPISLYVCLTAFSKTKVVAFPDED